MGGALVPGQRELLGGPLCRPGLAPLGSQPLFLGSGPMPSRVVAPSLPKEPDQPSRAEPGLCGWSPRPSLQRCPDGLFGALPRDPGPVLVLPQPPGPAPPTTWGQVPTLLCGATSASPGTSNLGTCSQWTRPRSQNTPNRWAELPGGQRTENLVGGDWGVTEVQGGRRALKEEPEFYRKSGEGLPGTVQPKQRGVSAGRRAGSSGHVWNMATAYRKCVAGAGAFTTPPGWDKT